ncbi:SpoVG family protein [Lapidilactobacillus mulanensis]|uniref:SpoVG family protein n=2 Tax=Lactobacillaceae TaxID=33958 RepID=A0ABW4DLA5_9LACO|nr:MULTISPECIES: SpoVG family protein [Lactobacillaceae]
MFISAINMYPSDQPNVLLDGEIILNHCLIIKDIQLIQGNYRLFLNFPQNETGRTTYPLNKYFYNDLLSKIIEYYKQLKPDN